MRKPELRPRHYTGIAVGAALLALLAGVLFFRSPSTYNDERDRIATVVEQWIGKTLTLPHDVGWLTTNGDTIDASFPTTKFTILRYISKEGCTSCRLHLDRYADILTTLSKSAKSDVGFVCIVNPNDINELRRLLRRDNYAALTIWIDEADTLNKINQFPEMEALHTFLIDNDHKIIAIGDPAVNPRLTTHFAALLSNDTINQAHLPKTLLTSDSEELMLGKVQINDTIRCSVKITNIGRAKFVVDKVITSCDCTKAGLSSDTIPPGCSATLNIQFSDDKELGEFYRTVSLFGNTDDVLTIELTGILTK